MHHVQPDIRVLQEMVALRVHLDDADENNGCLKVIPESHRLGILSQGDIDLRVKGAEVHLCSAKAGDVLVMRPHLLHASSKGNMPCHRRVVHVEYSSFALPQGLAWA